MIGPGSLLCLLSGFFSVLFRVTTDFKIEAVILPVRYSAHFVLSAWPRISLSRALTSSVEYFGSEPKNWSTDSFPAAKSGRLSGADWICAAASADLNFCSQVKIFFRWVTRGRSGYDFIFQIIMTVELLQLGYTAFISPCVDGAPSMFWSGWNCALVVELICVLPVTKSITIQYDNDNNRQIDVVQDVQTKHLTKLNAKYKMNRNTKLNPKSYKEHIISTNCIRNQMQTAKNIAPRTFQNE